MSLRWFIFSAEEVKQRAFYRPQNRQGPDTEKQYCRRQPLTKVGPAFEPPCQTLKAAVDIKQSTDNAAQRQTKNEQDGKPALRHIADYCISSQSNSSQSQRIKECFFGFLTRDDLQIFKLLIGVSGIGPKGALGILSTISPNQFRFAVMAGDARAISKAPGIGPKTAQKLIIELKDKLKLEDVFETPDAAAADIPDVSQGAKKEAMMALVSLGYSETEAFRAMQKIEASDSMDSETLLKLALKQMLTF